MCSPGEVHPAGDSWLPAHPRLLRRPPAPAAPGQSGARRQPGHGGPAPEAAQDARPGQAAAANTVIKQ